MAQKQTKKIVFLSGLLKSNWSHLRQPITPFHHKNWSPYKWRRLRISYPWRRESNLWPFQLYKDHIHNKLCNFWLLIDWALFKMDKVPAHRTISIHYVTHQNLSICPYVNKPLIIQNLNSIKFLQSTKHMLLVVWAVHSWFNHISILSLSNCSRLIPWTFNTWLMK